MASTDDAAWRAHSVGRWEREAPCSELRAGVERVLSDRYRRSTDAPTPGAAPCRQRAPVQMEALWGAVRASGAPQVDPVSTSGNDGFLTWVCGAALFDGVRWAGERLSVPELAPREFSPRVKATPPGLQTTPPTHTTS